MKQTTIYQNDIDNLPTHVNEIKWKHAKRIIKNNHYLQYAPPGMKFCLGVFVESEIIGVMIFGRPIARLEDQKTTLELTRMFVFESPKNSESKALSLAEKHIKKNYPHVIRIIAYSDTQQGHKGTIYKAANWKHTKKVKPAPWSNRKNRRGIIGGEKLKFERHLYPNNHQ